MTLILLYVFVWRRSAVIFEFRSVGPLLTTPRRTTELVESSSVCSIIQMRTADAGLRETDVSAV